MRSALLSALLVLEFCVGGLSAACSSSTAGVPKPLPEGGEASTDAARVKDVTPDVILDPKNCVAPGAAGYCSPGGGQCDTAGPGGMAEICTGDLAGTPKHAWYCTLPCGKPGDCRAGDSCASTPMGSRCVPKGCTSLLPDGGPTDSGVPEEAATDGGAKDSATDGSTEGSTDSATPG